jgi:V/A-type H+-transporting ATPase subunit K
MKTYASLGALAALTLPAIAVAQEAETVNAVSSFDPRWGLLLAFIGAAMATFLSSFGSILGVSMVGQAGAGLVAEKPDLAGRVITLAVLPGSQGLYGMVISLLFIFNYGPVITGDVNLTLAQGFVLFTAFLPVAITCLTSAPYQAKVCSAGMHMLAKDGRLAGRVITLAALVETYALLGFLISFFMLNTFRSSILG